VQLNNVQHVSSINKNLVSDSILYRDGFKVVLESNKFVVSNCGQFIGKGYVCRCLFRFSVSNFPRHVFPQLCVLVVGRPISIKRWKICDGLRVE
jgi:hypothetical protein